MSDLLDKHPERIMLVIKGNICWGTDVPVPTEYETDQLQRSVLDVFRRSLSQVLTVAPRDHMSAGGPHLRFNCASGLLKMAALIV